MGGSATFANPHGNTLAAGVLRGQVAQRELRTAEGLRAGAQRVIEVASSLGCSNLVSASEDARGVLAVAVALSRGEVREVSPDEIRSGTADKILVVESVAVSGRQVRRVVASSRAAGVSWVAAVIVAAVGDALDADWLDVDDLAV